MESIWSRTVEIPERDSLNEDIKVEAAVIGAGMAGILTAYLLKERGISAVVLEADRIAGGQTRNTTAKITSQHGLIYQKLIHTAGREKARLYARAHEEAIAAYAKLIETRQIDCHFKRLSSYLYSVSNQEALRQEAQAAAELGLPAHFCDRVELPIPTVGAVCFERQAQFHPLEFLKAVSQELTVYEKTRVLFVRGGQVHTDGGVVTAKHIIFACHYPIVNVPGLYFARQHQERSYVAAYENAGAVNGMYYSMDKDGLSLRMYENLLLVGGGAHRTGENKDGGKFLALREKAERYFPGGREIAHWAAQDCMTHDYLPFMGKYSWLKPDWYVATGFKKWGMTCAMLAAMIICDEISGVGNPYRELFSPRRLHVRAAAGNFLLDMGKSVKGLARGLFLCSPKAGKPHRCPHMGCELIWNPDEESWDCPCHGSRFDRHGKLLDDPAQTDLDKIK